MWAVLAVLVPEQAGSIRERQADPKVPGKKAATIIGCEADKNVACLVLRWSKHIQL